MKRLVPRWDNAGRSAGTRPPTFVRAQHAAPLYKNYRKALLLALCLSLALLGTRCGGGGGSGGGPPSVVAVAISPLTATLNITATQQFSATVTGTTNTTVTWSVAGTGCGSTSPGTISISSGLYTAPSSVPACNPVNVTATSKADSTKSATASVTIQFVAATLSSLSPIVAMQGSGGFSLTANGSNFTPSSQVVFNGVGETTTFVSSSQLTASVSAGDISQPGTFPVTVQSSGMASSAVNFYVVPTINMKSVSVVAGGASPLVPIEVQSPTPSLSLVGVGVGTKTAASGAEVKQGGSARLFIVGNGVVPGTFYVITGNPGEVQVTQPLASAFGMTTPPPSPAFPDVRVQITVSLGAAPGPRNILVTNPAGEISVFVGGLLITLGP